MNMPSRKNFLNCFRLALALSCVYSPVQAQTIDYGSLEALFGEPVTTSATGQPQRVPDAPVTMKIITAEDIRRSGATNISDALRHSVGVTVWQWTRFNADVSVRGYNRAFSPRLLVLVNGRQVYNDDYGHVAWETIPVQLEEIRQIEVVKGPNSALFGFNAVGGVVNIITYNPIYDNVSGAGLQVGTDSYRKGHALHTQKFGDTLAVRLSGSALRADDFDPPPGTVYIDSDIWSYALDGLLQVTENSQLRLETNASASDIARFGPTYTPSPESRHETSSVKLTYSANIDKGLFQANIYRNNQNKKGDPSFPFLLDNDVTVVQAEYLFPLGARHNFRIQAEHRHNALEGHPLLITAGSKIFYDVYAGSGMWNWKIRDNLTWTNAARIDRLELGRDGPLQTNAALTSNTDFDRELTEYSYNSGLVWRPGDKDTLRLMTARGVQAPSLFEMGQTLVFGPAVTIGNPDLDPSIVTNYEVGYNRTIDDIGGAFRANLFYQETQDIKSDSVITTGLTTQPGNIGESSTIGLELGLEGAFAEHWNWDANYKIQDTKDDININQAGAITSAYNGEDVEPTHALNLHLGYTNGKWEADAFAHYVSEYKVLRGPNAYTPIDAGSFISFSGRVGYKITDNVAVAVSGQDLLEHDVQETSAPGKERQVFLSLTASF